jgi:serine/threonine-protein kinase
MLDELLRSDSPSGILGTVVSMSPDSMAPGVQQTPMMTVPLNNGNSGNYHPTIIAAHPSYPTQAIQQPSVVMVPKPGISDWAKAMIMGGFIGTFVLIAIFISRPQQTTQVANNSSTALPASPTPVPSVAPAASPVAAVPQSAPQPAPPQTIIVQAATPASEKETPAEKPVRETEPAPTKKANNTGNTNATIVGQPGSKNIRSGPGTVYGANHIAYPGNRVRILERGSDSGGYTWYKVYFPESGADGWIAGQLLSID